MARQRVQADMEQEEDAVLAVLSCKMQELLNAMHLMKDDIDRTMKKKSDAKDFPQQQRGRSDDGESPDVDVMQGAAAADEGSATDSRDSKKPAEDRPREDPCKWHYLLPYSESVCSDDGGRVPGDRDPAAFSLPKDTRSEFRAAPPSDISSGYLDSEFREGRSKTRRSRPSFGDSDSREFLRRDLSATFTGSGIGGRASSTVVPPGVSTTGEARRAGEPTSRCRHPCRRRHGSWPSEQRWRASPFPTYAELLFSSGRFDERDSARSATPTRRELHASAAGCFCGSHRASDGARSPVRPGGIGPSMRAIASSGTRTTCAAVRWLMFFDAGNCLNDLVTFSLCLMLVLILCIVCLWLLSNVCIVGKATSCWSSFPV